MTNFRPHWSRRQYLVNPAFQLRFMGYWSLLTLIGLAVMCLSNYFYFDAVYEMGSDLDLDKSHPYFEFIDSQRALLIKIYLALSLVAFSISMIGGLLLSHRIAGPIYRIEKYLVDVAAGDADLAPVRLRSGDFFPEIAGIVNSAITHFDDEMQRRLELVQAGKIAPPASSDKAQEKPK